MCCSVNAQPGEVASVREVVGIDRPDDAAAALDLHLRLFPCYVFVDVGRNTEGSFPSCAPADERWWGQRLRVKLLPVGQ
jgi:hypothetical protein